uniref:Uncharacterized protein n=1 Tax=Brassica oleracea TaxID=3712 RepID=A0A3P6FLZ7_BRAOL|nr:unnamed protein product [Brassica oleracea]
MRRQEVLRRVYTHSPRLYQVIKPNGVIAGKETWLKPLCCMEKGIAPDTYTYRSLIHGQVEHLKPKSLWIAFTRRTMNSTRYEEDWRRS